MIEFLEVNDCATRIEILIFKDRHFDTACLREASCNTTLDSGSGPGSRHSGTSQDRDP